jgi:hypothetical protein
MTICVSVSDVLSTHVVEILDFSPEVVLDDEILSVVALLDDTIYAVLVEDQFNSCG